MAESYIKVKITDTNFFKEFLNTFQEIIEDKRVPNDIKIEAKEKINAILNKYKDK